MEGKAHVRKRLFARVQVHTAPTGQGGRRVDVRDGERRRSLRSSVGKTVDVSPSGNGTSTLELKAGVSYGMKHQKPEVEGKLELTQKVFNFQEDQDFASARRLRFGGRKTDA